MNIKHNRSTHFIKKDPLSPLYLHRIRGGFDKGWKVTSVAETPHREATDFVALKTPHRHLVTGNSATNGAVEMYRNMGKYRTFR